MKYKIFIDESGSINSLGKGIFEICILLIKDDDFKKGERFFSRLFKQFKKNNKIEMHVELKAHYLKNNNRLDIIEKTFIRFIDNNKAISAYVINKKIRNKRNLGNEKFYDMVKISIKEAKTRKYLKSGDEIEIYSDARKEIISKKENLILETKKNLKIKITKFEFLDSKKNTMIQVADHLSFMCHRIIRDSLKNNQEIPRFKNLNFIKVPY